MRENHPEGTEAARKVWEQVSAAREALRQLQLTYPQVADYRITQSEEALREADRLTHELADGTTKELDAIRARIAKDPSHPLHPNHGESKARVATAQIRYGTKPWETVGTNEDPRKAAELLGDDMQKNGLRYNELGGKHGHYADLESGYVLSADNGVSFRVVRAGEDLTDGE